MHNQIETFKIAVRKFAPFESAIQKFWDQYCEFSGCTIKLEMVVMDLHELYDKTISKKGLANGDFDIAHISTDWVLEGYSHHDFEVLNPYINKNKPEDFPRGWSKSLLTLQRFGWEIVGLPFHDGPECLIYRKDLFESDLEQTRFLAKYGKPLEAPKTWEDFHQIAQYFNRPEDNLYGSIFACYHDGHNTVFDFCLQLWTRGGSLTDKSGFIQINTEAAISGLDFYRKIVNDKTAVHPKSAEFESVAAGIAFSQGEAAMMINWFGFAAMCEIDANSKVKGKVDVGLLPAAEGKNSASLNVYWLYTIAKGSKNKDLAYDFLRFALAQEQDKQLTMEGGIGCRISTWNDAEINAIIPYYHKLETLHEVANMLPQKQNWAAIAAIIDQMVLQAVNTETPSEALILEAQNQINKIDK
ncbi:extracellular solute-binding protein [Pedobacter sp. MC2016-05]|uniref:extracellular solute-binding protein n=1 Tax=Pedobacter sp. MC2016-05 TaxID=2994474 RepID=UPI002245EC59|nr:extracellular solute-binding protein [Pedobacter sp. MC2016-05]MCX2476627.1 extracellular solute-binding protein [Pedobacter sp. MC2016-05]